MAAIAFGDAEASIAIIATRTEEETASATTFGKRCVVLPLTNCVSEPLFMWTKFAGAKHGDSYGRSTITQLWCVVSFIRSFSVIIVANSCD